MYIKKLVKFLFIFLSFICSGCLNSKDKEKETEITVRLSNTLEPKEKEGSYKPNDHLNPKTAWKLELSAYIDKDDNKSYKYILANGKKVSIENGNDFGSFLKANKNRNSNTAVEINELDLKDKKFYEQITEKKKLSLKKIIELGEKDYINNSLVLQTEIKGEPAQWITITIGNPSRLDSDKVIKKVSVKKEKKPAGEEGDKDREIDQLKADKDKDEETKQLKIEIDRLKSELLKRSIKEDDDELLLGGGDDKVKKEDQSIVGLRLENQNLKAKIEELTTFKQNLLESVKKLDKLFLDLQTTNQQLLKNNFDLKKELDNEKTKHQEVVNRFKGEIDALNKSVESGGGKDNQIKMLAKENSDLNALKIELQIQINKKDILLEEEKKKNKSLEEQYKNLLSSPSKSKSKSKSAAPPLSPEVEQSEEVQKLRKELEAYEKNIIKLEGKNIELEKDNKTLKNENESLKSKEDLIVSGSSIDINKRAIEEKDQEILSLKAELDSLKKETNTGNTDSNESNVGSRRKKITNWVDSKKLAFGGGLLAVGALIKYSNEISKLASPFLNKFKNNNKSL